VQPDIVFVAKENFSILGDTVHGVPDLLVEVLSPGNKSYDLETKKELYERFGVSEYWILDPISRQAIGYALVDSKYIQISNESGRIVSRLLDHTFDF
jgi:Uma2 family endonuclease